jgi:hypothetical protein
MNSRRAELVFLLPFPARTRRAARGSLLPQRGESWAIGDRPPGLGPLAGAAGVVGRPPGPRPRPGGWRAPPHPPRKILDPPTPTAPDALVKLFFRTVCFSGGCGNACRGRLLDGRNACISTVFGVYCDSRAREGQDDGMSYMTVPF